ncbi:type III pantothenate kinase [Cesiribacter andamanensis]|uniref:Type III pantothenate kinase n=1 Tax=Cesiribacter andamanensis AMV16 TaxID=1279009 RepID=M7MW22_9BACT|nr:type III pantothenate kinase [Cesiribacter andamanensis]EMR00643.1 Type III pantothenate kinase [Cesiribacter andamanensis AMV16]
MRSIAIDVGNTRAKAALFEQQQLLEVAYGLEQEAILPWCLERRQGVEAAIIASVGAPVAELQARLGTHMPSLLLTPDLPLPLRTDYATPQSLGADRIAAAVGGAARFSGQAVLVFDAGTCLTHELVRPEGVYAGGAISPGLQMRLQAMHQFTARLPLAPLEAGSLPPLPGRSTQECLQAGAFWGMLGEIEYTIGRYRQIYPHLQVILCGGDAKVLKTN